MIAEQVMGREDIQWVRNTFHSAVMFEKMKAMPTGVHELLLNILKQAVLKKYSKRKEVFNDGNTR